MSHPNREARLRRWLIVAVTVCVVTLALLALIYPPALPVLQVVMPAELVVLRYIFRR